MIKHYKCQCGYQLSKIYDYRTAKKKTYCRICKKELKEEVKHEPRRSKR